MLLRGVASLTNRFHVAVRLFSDRSQMTSKCGKNKIKKTSQEHGSSFAIFDLQKGSVNCKTAKLQEGLSNSKLQNCKKAQQLSNLHC